jgi:hypothetical protein
MVQESVQPLATVTVATAGLHAAPHSTTSLIFQTAFARGSEIVTVRDGAVPVDTVTPDPTSGI